MRLYLLLLVSIVSNVTYVTVGRAEDERPADDLKQAERDVEIAQLRLRRYETYEYPLALRKLESQIKLTEPEIAIWQRRVKEYADLDRFVGSSGVLITLAEARQSLLAAETALDDLRDEKHRLQNQHVDQCRLLELELESACDRLARFRLPPIPAVPASVRRATTPRAQLSSRAKVSSSAAAKAP